MKPLDPNYAARVRDSFSKQPAMTETIGAVCEAVEPGLVVLSFKFKQQLTQQHGFIHAGMLAGVVDSACGYAALSLMPTEAAVLTIEYKVNLLRPAAGERFVATGLVVKPGKSVSVCDGRLYAQTGDDANAPVSAGAEQPGKLVATMSATMMTLVDRGLKD